MFGLSFEKILIIAGIAVLLLGPDRLPTYAAQFGRLVRKLRDMANGAKDRMREEMGPEFEEVDWKKLDPRQYDPRRIIREALLDDDDEPQIVRPAGSSESDDADDASQNGLAPLAFEGPTPYDREAT